MKTNDYLHVKATKLIALKCRHVAVTKAFVDVGCQNWRAKVNLVCRQLLDCSVHRLDDYVVVFLRHAVEESRSIHRLHNSHNVVGLAVQSPDPEILLEIRSTPVEASRRRQKSWRKNWFSGCHRTHKK